MKSLLLLHGAIGCSSQLIPFKEEFQKDNREVFLFDFPGHGGKKFPPVTSGEEFSIKLFAESVLGFLDENKISCADIFGYSMGGYVALYLARHHSERVGKVMTLATKFDWTEESSSREVKMLNPEKIAEKVPRFAAALEKNHAPNDWKMVLQKTAEMMLALGKNPELKEEDFSAIRNSVLLCVGDKDAMVSKDETSTIFRQLKNAEMKIILETPHPIEQVEVGRVVSVAREFFV